MRLLQKNLLKIFENNFACVIESVSYALKKISIYRSKLSIVANELNREILFMGLGNQTSQRNTKVRNFEQSKT